MWNAANAEMQTGAWDFRLVLRAKQKLDYLPECYRGNGRNARKRRAAE
jgi:hypothetical protein